MYESEHMALTEESKDLIILILIVSMVLVLVVELMYMRSKKKQKKSKYEENKADEAYNKIHTADRIISTMRSQGVDVHEAELLLKEARRYESSRNFDSAIERAERSKIILRNAKRDHDMKEATNQNGIGSEQINTVSEITSNNIPANAPLPSPIEEVRSAKRPKNFLQAKFLLTTVKDLMENEENQGIEEARQMFEDAKDEFAKENYTKALSLALKTEKMLKVGGFDHIAETSQPHSEEHTDDDPHNHYDEEEPKIIDLEGASCDSCGTDADISDAFCRKCGDKLEFIIICPSCDAEVQPDDVFCRKCGQKLG